ncbi:hypothetical protein NKG94_02065 [Micromonospora sp. M12]
MDAGFPHINPVPPTPEQAAGAFIYMDGIDHVRLRKMLLPEFMLRNVKRVEPLIEQSVIECLDSIAAAGAPADMITSFALPVPSMTICHLLGVPYEEHDYFQKLSLAYMDRASTEDEINAVGEGLTALMVKVIEQKFVNPVTT